MLKRERQAKRESKQETEKQHAEGVAQKTVDEQEQRLDGFSFNSNILQEANKEETRDTKDKDEQKRTFSGFKKLPEENVTYCNFASR